MDYLNENAGQNICQGCGQILAPGGKFCPVCGSPAVSGGTGGTVTGSAVPQGVSLKEYCKTYAPEKLRKSLRNWCIVAYVLVGVNVLFSLLVNPLALVDTAILLGLTLGMHLGKSKGCAIGMIVYSAISMVVGLIATGSLSGWMWLCVGLAGYQALKKMAEQYKEDSKPVHFSYDEF